MGTRTGKNGSPARSACGKWPPFSISARRSFSARHTLVEYQVFERYGGRDVTAWHALWFRKFAMRHDSDFSANAELQRLAMTIQLSGFLWSLRGARGDLLLVCRVTAR